MLVLGGVSHLVMELAKARGAEVVNTASAAKHSQSHVIESRYVTLLNIMFGPTCTSLDRAAPSCCAHTSFSRAHKLLLTENTALSVTARLGRRELVRWPSAALLSHTTIGATLMWVCRLCHYINSSARCRICGSCR